MRLSRQEYQDIRRREAENKKWYARSDGRAAMPHTICLSVNNNCYMRCKMCDIGATNEDRRRGLDQGYFSDRYRREGRYLEFPLERLKELVDEVAPKGPIIKVNFVEPLLYKGLEEFAGHVKRRGLKFYTITNGWLLKRHARWLAELPADLIRVSLDGPEDVHDDVRGIRGSFAKTMEGLHELIRSKADGKQSPPILGLCYTISSYNYDRLVEMMDLLDREGLLEHIYVSFNHLYYTTPWEVERTRGAADMFQDIKPCSMDHAAFERMDVECLSGQIAQLRRKYDSKRYHYYFSPQLELDDLASYYDPNQWMFPGTPCYLPWYAAQISIDGEVGVWGHCMLPSFGNVMEHGFDEVWNSEKAQAVRLELKAAGSYPMCNKCIGTLYPLRGRD